MSKSMIYTRAGDKGETSLFSGGRVTKDVPRLEAYGTLDEAMSHIGLARALLPQVESGDELRALDDTLSRVQHLMFNLGSVLACASETLPPGLPSIGQKHVDWMESRIDELDAALPPLKQFVLPGGSPAAASLHVARTVVRRCERLVIGLSQNQEAIPPECIVFLNRLSDFLFVLARHENLRSGHGDVTWNKQAVD